VASQTSARPGVAAGFIAPSQIVSLLKLPLSMRRTTGYSGSSPSRPKISLGPPISNACASRTDGSSAGQSLARRGRRRW
jgi:hypothetical protein